MVANRKNISHLDPPEPWSPVAVLVQPERAGTTGCQPSTTPWGCPSGSRSLPAPSPSTEMDWPGPPPAGSLVPCEATELHSLYAEATWQLMPRGYHLRPTPTYVPWDLMEKERTLDSVSRSCYVFSCQQSNWGLTWVWFGRQEAAARWLFPVW